MNMGGLGENCKVGGGNHGRDNLVRPSKGHQVPSLGGLVAEWVDTQLPAAPIQPELWTMFFDGSLMKTGAGAGLLFISPLDEISNQLRIIQSAIGIEGFSTYLNPCVDRVDTHPVSYTHLRSIR